MLNHVFRIGLLGIIGLSAAMSQTEPTAGNWKTWIIHPEERSAYLRPLTRRQRIANFSG